MTTQKDFKRLVRARMAKTGESYTAARYRLLNKSQVPGPQSQEGAPGPSPQDFAKIAGMSDAALKKATGCTWEKWVKSLDHHGAREMTHTEIAKLATKTYKAGPWWGQMVAVGYERIRGLRARQQQRDGSFRASKSRTFNVPIEVLFDAWNDASTRKKWLNGDTGQMIKVRKAARPKSLRLDWSDGTIVPVGFLVKGKSKSSVFVEQVKLKSKDEVERAKADWGSRFDALAEVLAR